MRNQRVVAQQITRGLSCALLAAGIGSLLPGIAAAAQPEAPVVLGAAIAETGGAATLGAGEANAINLRVKRINAAGGIDGHPLKVVLLDTGGQPQRAVLDTRQFITQDNVLGVICCTTSPESMAIIKPLQRAKVPMVSLGDAASIVEPVEERHWVFKTPPLSSFQAMRDVEDMKRLGIGSIGLMYASDAFGESGAQEVREAAGKEGIKVVGAETFQLSDTDMSAQAAKLTAAKPQAVVIWSITPAANVAQKALRAAGFSGTVYQSSAITNPSFFKLGGAAVNGTRTALYPLAVWDQIPDSAPYKPVLVRFVHEYKEEFGVPPTTFSGHAWDAIEMFKLAAEQIFAAGTPKLSDTQAFRAALRERVENLHFEGQDGTFRFSKTNHAGTGDNSTLLAVADNGRFVLVKADLGDAFAH